MFGFLIYWHQDLLRQVAGLQLEVRLEGDLVATDQKDPSLTHCHHPPHASSVSLPLVQVESYRPMLKVNLRKMAAEAASEASAAQAAAAEGHIALSSLMLEQQHLQKMHQQQAQQAQPE